MYLLARITKYSDTPGSFIDVYHKSFDNYLDAVKVAQIGRYDLISIDDKNYTANLGMPDELKKDTNKKSKRHEAEQFEFPEIKSPKNFLDKYEQSCGFDYKGDNYWLSKFIDENPPDHINKSEIKIDNFSTEH